MGLPLLRIRATMKSSASFGNPWWKLISHDIYTVHISISNLLPRHAPFCSSQPLAFSCFFNTIPIQSQKAEPIVPSSCGLFSFRNSPMKRFAKSQQTSCNTANSLPTIPKTGWLSVSNLHCGEMDCLNLNQIVPRLVLLTLKMYITSVLGSIQRTHWTNFTPFEMDPTCAMLIHSPFYSLRLQKSICILCLARLAKTCKKKEFIDRFAAVAW